MSEEKKIEDLLKPRYKVIALWPTCSTSMKVGNIIVYDDEFDIFWIDGNAYNPKNVKLYPHLFKPLAWWEDRKPEEMPKYVKETEATEYDTIVYYYKLGIDFKYIFSRNCIELTMKKDTRRIHLMYITPAAESEYTTYLNNKPK